MNKQNALWNFFSSVKLALFTLCSLAVTSIIGTIIPQKEQLSFYAGKYGVKTAQFFQVLDIDDMYGSWWFLALLAILCANLIVCSIDRFPKVWQMIKQDNLDLPLERIKKIGLGDEYTTARTLEESADDIQSSMAAKGWKTEKRENSDSLLLFSQKSAWSRCGVYLVHLSILVIFAGAIYGQLTGFKGSIMLPELQSSGVVYATETGSPIDLGFEVRCDRFDIEFYDNTMPKEYRSKLVVLEDGKEVLQKDIEVNAPLKYKGITFYQSSYQGYRDFVFSVSEDGQTPTIFTGDYQKEIVWQDKNIKFGIINLESMRDRVVRLKIWFNDDHGEPSQFWMNPGESVKVNRAEKAYLFSAKQRYATGLQVAKDPGVWIVYLGCGAMLLGLYMAFFMSHKRIWLILRKEDQQTTIQLRGTSNKNKAGFSNIFNELSSLIRGIV